MRRAEPLTLAAPTQHLGQLCQIRWLLLAFLWLSFLGGLFFLSFNSAPIFAVLALFTTINSLSFLRLRDSLAVSETEFFVQLLIDVIALNILFYFSGGATNPFISYLLVPICIAAATLPWRLTSSITALSLIGYTLLLFYNRPFPLFAVNHESHQAVSWHILGMWFNFFISAILITYFVVKMASNLRQQQIAISRLREDELRNEQLMAVAILAAGTAHEINTPLSTMSLLLKDLREDYKTNPSLSSDLALLSQQVEQCAATLKDLVKNSSAATRGNFKAKTIQSFCASVIDRWQLIRPNVTLKLVFTGDNFSQLIALDPRLDQAIINLLNNAADASPDSVDVEILFNHEQLIWIIKDTGTGIEETAKPIIGKQTHSTKAQGLGLGMVITQATLTNYGGSVTQTNNTPSGTITRICIPVTA